MKGIRLIRLLDVLPVTAAQNAPGVVPRSLIISASNFEAIDQVLFNGVPSPQFSVYSRTQLIAQVPEALEDAIITDVAVLSSVPTLTQRSLIEFGVGRRITTTSGTQRLIQTFVRMLMRTAGTNIFHRNLGGGVQGHIGQNIRASVAADVAVAISTVKRQIIAAQTPYSAIPPSERLLSAEISALREDPANTSIYCTVLVTSHDRQRSAATLIA